MSAVTALQSIERAKGRQKALAEVNAALRKEIERGGPLLIWLGTAEFPRDRCSFRGVSVGKGRIRLTEWLNCG